MFTKNAYVVTSILFASLIVINSVNAQDEQPGAEISTSQQIEMTVIGSSDIGGPMIFSTSESFGAGGATMRMGFSDGGPGMNMFGGGDFTMPAPDPLSMLSNPSVQKDLELVGDQLKQVQDLQAEFANQMKDQLGSLTNGGFSPEQMKGIPALIAKIKEKQKDQLESLLLPHQLERLKQVALQTHMKQAGTAGALATDQVADALGITSEQIENLKSRSKEINKKLQEDIESLKKEAQQELLGELTTDQQKKLKELTGDKYEPQNKDWEEAFKEPRMKRRRLKN
ncbi:hypothetical protein OAU26_00015 [Mariniblastus sp.]|nr:hypothetical protein [Mariniblastus sp.]MDB4386275.1 hypothetical protein [bacterium]MDA7928431.1 hypothetical protein [Mariniblastus sp.]MDB4357101.1 hypothetical protein [Mariniblastus sp.]MDB4396640.1 hypothetical protein [bacterium]